MKKSHKRPAWIRVGEKHMSSAFSLNHIPREAPRALRIPVEFSVCLIEICCTLCKIQVQYFLYYPLRALIGLLLFSSFCLVCLRKFRCFFLSVDFNNNKNNKTLFNEGNMIYW